MNAAIADARAATGRGNSWGATKNEDPQGSNPYAGGHQSVATALTSRKRDVKKERDISPVPFNATHRTSTRLDDTLKSKSLNQMNGRQLVSMLLKRQKSKVREQEMQMELTLMNEQDTISVI